MGILADWKMKWAKEQAELSEHPLSFWLELADMIVEGRKAIRADQMSPMGRNWTQQHWIDLLNKVYATAVRIEKEKGMEMALPIYEICVAEEMNNPELYIKLLNWYREKRWFKDGVRVSKINLHSSWPPGTPEPEVKFSGFTVDRTVRDSKAGKENNQAKSNPPLKRPVELPKANVQPITGKKDLDPKQVGMGVSVLLILFLCLICLCSSIFNGKGKEKNYELAAYVGCELYVKETLKAPASAEFPSTSTADIRELENKVFEIRSYVDAQNSFGAMIRTDFYCKIQYIGDPDGDELDFSKWILLDLQFSE